MALVLPVRGQADWDIANNNALIYLQSAINVASSQINGVTVSGTPNVDDVIKATSSVTAHWAPGGGAVGALLAANNLSDLQSAPTARTNLGLEQRYGLFLAPLTQRGQQPPHKQMQALTRTHR